MAPYVLARDELRSLPRLVLWLLAVSASISSAAAADVADEATDNSYGSAYHNLASEYVDARGENVRLQAVARFIASDLPQLTDVPYTNWRPAIPAGVKDNEVIGLLFQNLRTESAAQVKTNLDNLIAEQEQQLEQAKEQLTTIRAARYQWQATSGGGFLEPLLGRQARGWRFACCFLFLIAALIRWHLHRHQWRSIVSASPRPWLRRTWLRVAMRMAGAVIVAAGLIYSDLWFSKSDSRFRDEINQLANPLAALRQSTADSVQEHRAACENWLDGVSESERAEAKSWKEVRLGLPRLVATTQTRQDLITAVAEDAATLKEAGVGDSSSEPRYADLFFGSWVLATCGFLGWTYVGHRRFKFEVRRTCPLCLSPDHLAIETSSSTAAAASVQTIRCQNEVAPGQECGFAFPRLYQSYRKLYFPTMGIPQSGKTFWLAMTYSELMKGNFDQVDVEEDNVRQVHCSPLRCEQATEFQKLAEDIIGDRTDTGATQTNEIPHPLIFNFADRDPLGKSNVLANVFDYSGEVTRRFDLSRVERQRALTAEGYLYFLDPTKDSEEQASELVNFQEDVRVVMHALGRKDFHAPVALCVSKLDMMVNQSYYGPEIDDFYNQLAEIDPSGTDMSLRTIQARSDLMRELRHVIWQQWNIEKQIREIFGDRFMYFPMTPIGLQELGVENLADRTILPFHIVEPLLWLLHANGYSTLR